jgi:hypothetical protein
MFTYWLDADAAVIKELPSAAADAFFSSTDWEPPSALLATIESGIAMNL